MCSLSVRVSIRHLSTPYSTVLGYNWDPEKDLLGVSFKYNTSRKNKGRRISPNLGLKDPQEFRLAYHNRRTLLSMCNGIYDLLGLCSLYTIKFKILMKETLNIEIPGDSNGAISSALIEEWSKTMLKGISMQAL